MLKNLSILLINLTFSFYAVAQDEQDFYQIKPSPSTSGYIGVRI